MIGLLDRIQDEVTRAFFIRAYNNFIGFILPIVAGAILTYFKVNELPIEASNFADPQLWNVVIGSVIITLLGSAGTGVLKAGRVVGDIHYGMTDEG